VPSYFQAVGNLLYFTAQTPRFGYELWRSDGTTAGTVIVKNINLTRSSYPESPAELGGTLFFQADDGRVGEELWALTPCGDGTLNPGEQCDDGNVASGDGCSDRCRLEESATTTSTTTTTDTIPSTSTPSSTTSTSGATATSTSPVATTTAPSVTTMVPSTSTTSTLPQVCDPATAWTCDTDQCGSPKLRRRAKRLATLIQHAIDVGRRPRTRMVHRLTKVLARCGVLTASSATLHP